MAYKYNPLPRDSSKFSDKSVEKQFIKMSNIRRRKIDQK